VADKPIPEMVERIARIIDPEAFGLPKNPAFSELSDRDEAREKAQAVIAVIGTPTKTPEMVDRVAIEMFYSSRTQAATPWVDVSEHTRDLWRAYATAAIKGMREPTSKMVTALRSAVTMVDGWRPAIDAALE
jgi:hypothetical protein